MCIRDRVDTLTLCHSKTGVTGKGQLAWTVIPHWFNQYITKHTRLYRQMAQWHYGKESICIWFSCSFIFPKWTCLHRILQCHCSTVLLSVFSKTLQTGQCIYSEHANRGHDVSLEKIKLVPMYCREVITGRKNETENFIFHHYYGPWDN